MSILNTLTVVVFIAFVAVALILAEDVKNIVNNKQPQVNVKSSLPTISMSGLRTIRPSPNETHYTTDGTFTTKLQSQSTLKLVDFILTDPYEEEDCLMLTNRSGETITKAKPLSITARCQQITAGDPYRLSVNITYVDPETEETISEIGTIKGLAEQLSE